MQSIGGSKYSFNFLHTKACSIKIAKKKGKKREENTYMFHTTLL
jgi:hypothetical protein